MNLSDRGHLEPKLLVCSVMFSLVWESKDGFSISAFTNTQMWFFTCSDGGGISILPHTKAAADACVLPR